MRIIIAQMIGFVPSILCPINSFLPRRTQILLVTALANLCSATNFLLLGAPSSSAICFVAVTQTLLNFFLEKNGKPSPAWLNAVFAPFYIGASLLTFSTALDILPMAGAIFFLLSASSPRVIFMRLFSVANCLCWLVYSGIIGSSLIFTQIITLATLFYAIFRHFYTLYKQRKEKVL